MWLLLRLRACRRDDDNDDDDEDGGGGGGGLSASKYNGFLTSGSGGRVTGGWEGVRGGG